MQNSPHIYIRINDEELGPLSTEDIKTMVDEGRFGPDDFIRLAEREMWVKAKNVKHLNALFEDREKKQVAGAFENWIDQVKSGKPVTILSRSGVVAEKERIRQELAALESERTRVEAEEEAMRAADRLRITEIERLNAERARIDEEKEHLEMASDELNRMTISVRRRRFIPFIVSALAIIIVVGAGIPAYYYGLYLPGKAKEILAGELADKQKRYEELITQLEGKQDHLAFLELELIEALDRGDAEKASGIEAEIMKAQRDIDEIRIEISKESGKGLPADLAPNPQISGELEATGSSPRGSRSIEETNAIIRTIFPEVTVEYAGVLEEYPVLSGAVVVNISINKAGEVTEAVVVASDFSEKAPELENVIVRELEALEFEPARIDFDGSYIFDLKNR